MKAVNKCCMLFLVVVERVLRPRQVQSSKPLSFRLGNKTRRPLKSLLPQIPTPLMTGNISSFNLSRSLDSAQLFSMNTNYLRISRAKLVGHDPGKTTSLAFLPQVTTLSPNRTNVQFLLEWPRGCDSHFEASLAQNEM